MRLYSRFHDVSCGVDLHSRTMYLCVLDRGGQTLLHRNLPTRPEALLCALAPFRGADLVVGCECLFAWYWLADLCEAEGIPFVLGHALGMRSIHGLKTKSDKVDSWKIAQLLRGGNFPLAYVYPRGMRATRDLLRRRTYFVRQRAALFTHLQILNSQYNLPPLAKKLSFAANRQEMDVAARFVDKSVQKNAAVNLAVIDARDGQVADLELYLTRTAKVDDVQTYHRLQTIPGVVPSLADMPAGCRFRARCDRATEICARVDPELVQLGAGRAAACHNPVPAAGEEAA